eukprot:9251269-Heterocapsa_arctica.AAC.1
MSIHFSERGTIDRFFKASSQVDNPPENIPQTFSNTDMTIPGTAGIPAQHSSSSSSAVYPGSSIPAQHSSSFDNPARHIPRVMDYPAAGSGDHPHYSEHPA